MLYFNYIYAKFVVWGYVRYGMMYGDECSQAYMGECVNSAQQQFRFFEKRYIKMGFQPISNADFQIAGGYVGPEHLEPLLYKVVDSEQH